MTAALTVRPARADELNVVVDLWHEAARWLADRGLDQWQYPPRQESITRNIAAGECWLVEAAGTTIATLTVDHHADPEFWRAEDDPGSALYVHRMVVGRAAAGVDLGAALLDWASGRAAAEGKRWLRLDAWRTNEGLRRYYAGQGFALVRVVELPHRRSGALYQRPATMRIGRGPEIHELTDGYRGGDHPAGVSSRRNGSNQE